MLNVEVKTLDGSMGAYVATPKNIGVAPAVIILMEVFGVNRFIRRIADYWAEQGFIALAPDLYWRLNPGIQLDPETNGHREKALATRGRMDTDKAASDVEQCVKYLRNMKACSGKVGTSGYCLGGLLAYLSAVRGTADANVSYYGVGIEAYLKEAEALKAPFLFHMGETDAWTPIPVRRALDAALLPLTDVTSYTYEGTGHAFAREGASADVPTMRELANARTKAFFDRTLRSD